MGIVQFSLSSRDLLDCYRLHHRNRIRSRGMLIAACGLGIFCLALFAFDVWGVLMVVAIWLTLFAIIVAGTSVFYLPFFARRIFRQQKTLHGPINCWWTADVFQVSVMVGQSCLQWRDYVSWSESGKVLLLYQSSNLFQIVPKRAISQHDLDDIRQHLKTAGVPKTGW